MTSQSATTEAASIFLAREDLIADRALGPDDPDDLQHLPIARRVADLIVSTDTPANIALFGPWGSGKSSFAQLLRGCLEERKPKVGMVVYDAWTFEGESLQRNFISAAATRLGLTEDADSRNWEFHGGLYASRHSARVKLSKWDLAKLLLLATGIAALALVFLVLLVAGLALVLGEDPIASVVDAIPSLIPATAVAGLLGSITREILAGAKLEIDESAPTQEQFRAKFGSLVQRAMKEGGFERLVFFIDELDRCSPEQVMQILAAIRHFYHQDNCVFVIAADREVVELAIQQKSQQSTPINKESPYYSSASEYIDKVFQFQIALPPLRNRRLTRYARNLVADKSSGLWHELAAIDVKTRDRVMYVLIPSHVRSPRRVKVLLNNFATSARVTQARGLNWVDRAFEIAKLTVLRTEFPHFAVDLQFEPRLPRLVLDPPSNPSARVSELLERHYLPLTSIKKAAVPTAAEPELTATDPIVAKARPEDRVDLKSAERVNLRRYLMRTSAYPDPTRDLLFLEPAGAAVDLQDEVFGELIESDAIETPTNVVRAATNQEIPERLKAIRVLADMLGQEFGQERANLATALLGIAEQLEYDVAPHREYVLGPLELYLKEEGLDDAHLSGTLAIAIKEDDGESDLVEALMADPRLMSDGEQVERIAVISGGLTEDQQRQVWAKMAEYYPSRPALLVQPLRRLPSSTARAMLTDADLRKAIIDYVGTLDAEDAQATVDELFESANQRDDDDELIRGKLMWVMTEGGGSGVVYDQAVRHADTLAQFAKEPWYRNNFILRAIMIAPATDWSMWIEHLGSLSRGLSSDESERARNAIASVLKRWPSVGSSGPEAVVVLARLADHVLVKQDEDLAVEIKPLISISVGTWWTTTAATEAQRVVYQALLQLRGVGPVTHRVVSGAVSDDLARAFASAVSGIPLALVRETAPLLDKQSLDDIAAVLVALPGQAAPLDVDLIRTRLGVASAAKAARKKVTATPLMVSGADITSLLRGGGSPADLEAWYGLGPAKAEGIAVAVAAGPGAASELRSKAAKWASRLSPEQRTDLVLQLLKAADDVSSWISSLEPEPLDDLRLVSTLASRIEAETQGVRREDLARTLAAYRPSSSQAQKQIAGIVISLLEKDTQVDFNAAVIALGALGDNHGSGRRLADAFENASNRGRRIPRRALDDLRRARVPLHKKSMAEELWRAFRGR